MARIGIRSYDLTTFNAEVKCFMAEPEIAETARENHTTRAVAAVDAALEMMADGIYVVGNAPTALLHLVDCIQANRARPALVIGLPVGFVNAAESKEALMAMNHPYISNTGRKGGSNVAASVVNALITLALGNNNR
jgi:precorrin-8X/cobalt-precorrin-8 methylmutase